MGKKIKVKEIDIIGPKLPTTGPYKWRKPWVEWEGGKTVKPKETFDWKGEKYEFYGSGGIVKGFPKLAKKGWKKK